MHWVKSYNWTEFNWTIGWVSHPKYSGKNTPQQHKWRWISYRQAWRNKTKFGGNDQRLDVWIICWMYKDHRGKRSSTQSWAFSVFFHVFNKKKLFLCIFYQVNNLFLHQSYLKSPLPVKLTWEKMQKIIFYYGNNLKITKSAQLCIYDTNRNKMQKVFFTCVLVIRKTCTRATIRYLAIVRLISLPL